jgi:hypothetical protein
MERNIQKLVYNWIAKEYAVLTGHVSGRDLMSILSKPGHCDDKEKAEWTALLKELGKRCETFLLGTARPPTPVETAKNLTFLAYFQKLTRSEYPGAVIGSEFSNLQKMGMGTLCFEHRVYLDGRGCQEC